MKVYKFAILFVLVSFLGSSFLFSQYRISGFIKSKSSGEVLIGAQVFDSIAKYITNTDNHGHFSMVVSVPTTLKVLYAGCRELSINIRDKHDSLLLILLENNIELEEVEVRMQKTPSFNSTTLSHEEMINSPSLGAKPDVLKTLQLQPGIMSQNEGSSLLMVRGGNPGENLYLLDNVPLIYVNHLGGFMSVFNPDIINNVTLYKGGFPGRYGSKLSSIVDITQREGNKSTLNGSYSLGATDASFTLEGPLKLKNATFIITGRKTFTDFLLAAASSISEGNHTISYGFHDINGKLSWRPDLKNSFHFNIYQGDDYLNYWTKTEDNGITNKSHIGNKWGNWLLSSRWNHVLSDRLYTSTVFSYTRYRLKDINYFMVIDSAGEKNFDTKYISSVQDMSLRSDWKLNVMKNWSLDYGFQSSLFIHNPNQISSYYKTQNDNSIVSLEPALYFDNKINFGYSELNLGLRAVDYMTNGYSRFHLEPRMSLNIGINAHQIFNLSYMLVSQYSQLIFTSGVFSNNEVWIPADKTILPSQSQQYNAGWKGYFHEDMLQASVEIYYKGLTNLATYREGYTNLIGDENWREKIETGGKGTAYGVEFMFSKNSGKWNGYLSYTYSSATRQYPDINKGKTYVFEYDRPHCGSIVINYKFNEKLTINANWIYQTGLPYTPVIGRQYTPDLEKEIDGKPFYYEALIYGERNSSRMKDYHRLDIALHYSRLTKKRKMKSDWTFSVYNVYNRLNPYFYYYNTSESGEFYKPETDNDYWKVKLYQVSYLPFIPSVSYKVYFSSGIDKERTDKKIARIKRDKTGFYPRDSYIRKRLDIKLGYAFYPYSKLSSDDDETGTYTFRLKACYGISNHFSTGIYLGYGKYSSFGFFNPTQANSQRLMYGGNVDYHLVPYLVKRNDFRFDLYLSAAAGGIYYCNHGEYHIPLKDIADYGLYAGASFYLLKHIGVFVEYGYGNLTNLRYGLSVKINKKKAENISKD